MKIKYKVTTIIGVKAYRWLLLRVTYYNVIIIILAINKKVCNIVFYTCPSTSIKTN
jgi:hypothetical protein